MIMVTNASNLRQDESRLSLIVGQILAFTSLHNWLENSGICPQILSKLHNDALRLHISNLLQNVIKLPPSPNYLNCHFHQMLLRILKLHPTMITLSLKT